MDKNITMKIRKILSIFLKIIYIFLLIIFLSLIIENLINEIDLKIGNSSKDLNSQRIEIVNENENDLHKSIIPPTSAPNIISTPTKEIIDREDLGVPVDDVILYFKKIGYKFQMLDTYSTNEIEYLGTYKDAYSVRLYIKNNKFIEGIIDIDLIHLNPSNIEASTLGDLPLAIFGSDLYNTIVVPWFESKPSNNDTLCFDGIVLERIDYSKTRAEWDDLQLSIYLEKDCKWISGCCPKPH